MKKDKTIALILSIFVGGFGIDRFYLGYTGMGILKLLTGGLFGILWLIDVIWIATGKLGPADGSGYAEEELFVGTTVKPTETRDPYEELEKAGKLRDQGVITEEEFAKIKADILAKM